MNLRDIELEKLAIDGLNKAPTTAGVYIFLHGKKPTYIGKAVNLKARLLSHKQNAKTDQKEAAIFRDSDSVEYIVADSEFKALILEAKLIRKYMPKYNVRWRDDKSYLYIKVTTKDTYPKFFLTRREEDKKAIFYGPFSSVKVATNILREIRKVFPFCTQKKITKQKCFYAKIKQCNPCPNDIEKIEDPALKKEKQKEYRHNIKQVMRVLDGKVELVLKGLYDELHTAAAEQNFEEAILLRNRIYRLENVTLRRKFDTEVLQEYNTSERQLESLKKVLEPYFEFKQLARIECYDMSTTGFKDSTASMVVFTEGLSDRSEYKRFKIHEDKQQSDFDMFENVLTRRFKNNWQLPDLLVVDGGKPQVRRARQVLAQAGIDIPLIGIAKRPDRFVIGNDDFTMLRPPLHHMGLKLVQAIRDESHRFAKKYHVHLRNKKMLI
ncbi:MAG: GIY-YIG nuclease family protein [Weeksellaceae bacterium]